MPYPTSQLLNRRFNFAESGNNELISPTDKQLIRIYKAILTVNADINGEVILRLGDENLGGALQPKAGGSYLLATSVGAKAEIGGLGDALVCNLPAATSSTLNVTFELYEPNNLRG